MCALFRRFLFFFGLLMLHKCDLPASVLHVLKLSWLSYSSTLRALFVRFWSHSSGRHSTQIQQNVLHECLNLVCHFPCGSCIFHHCYMVVYFQRLHCDRINTFSFYASFRSQVEHKFDIWFCGVELQTLGYTADGAVNLQASCCVAIFFHQHCHLHHVIAAVLRS